MRSEREFGEGVAAGTPFELDDDQAGYASGLIKRMLDHYQGDPCGRETLVIGASVVTLADIPDFARSAICTVTDNTIRITFDQTAPTAAVGQAFIAGEHFTITGYASLKGLRAIRDAAADGTLDVEYFD